MYYQPDKSYQVTDRSYDSSEQSIKTVSTQVTLSGLYPGSTYTVKISSVNAVGTGAASTPVTAVLPPAGQEWERVRETEREGYLTHCVCVPQLQTLYPK